MPLFMQVKSLDNIHMALHSLAFMVSRSGFYLRMLPRTRCQTSSQEKEHVNHVYL